MMKILAAAEYYLLMILSLNIQKIKPQSKNPDHNI